MDYQGSPSAAPTLEVFSDLLLSLDVSRQGKLMRSLRQARFETQSDIAQVLGLSTSMVSLVERGKQPMQWEPINIQKLYVHFQAALSAVLPQVLTDADTSRDTQRPLEPSGIADLENRFWDLGLKNPQCRAFIIEKVLPLFRELKMLVGNVEPTNE
jgi:transcriptional regulator with XRE-family HTH domain